MLWKKLILALLALSLVACSEPPYRNVDNVGLQMAIDQGVPLIDIRRPEEWRGTGVVEGSQLLTFVDAGGRVRPGFLEALTKRFPRDQPVALICRTGSRTDALARHMMEQLGYTQVINVRDGITRWTADGFPVARVR